VFVTYYSSPTCFHRRCGRHQDNLQDYKESVKVLKYVVETLSAPEQVSKFIHNHRISAN